METVKKFYLAERINPSTKLPIFFINEMGVKTPAKQFNEFLSGLNEFINTAKDYKASAAIYFHKDDMYKGYLPYEKVISLVDKLSKEKVNNKTIIESLVTNKVLLPIVMPKGKSDTTMAMAVTALDLDEKAKEIKFMLSSKDKAIEDVVMGDIKWDLPGFQVEIIKTMINDGKLDIYYTVSKDGKIKSSPFIKSRTGFGSQKIEVSTARSIYEDMQIKTQNDASISKKFQTKAWIMFTALSVMAIISLIILVMVLIKMYVIK